MINRYGRLMRTRILAAGGLATAALAFGIPTTASAATSAVADGGVRTASATYSVRMLDAMASPASASTSGWFGLENSYRTGFCLDSNANKQVYVNPCQVPGNPYQDWTWQEYSGGYYQIKDKATGYCLDSDAAGQVYTNPCQTPGNWYQNWYMPGKPGTTYVEDANTGLELAMGSPWPGASGLDSL